MISVEELWNSGNYRHIKTIHYHEIVQFVMQNIRLKNAATISYFLYNIVTFVVLTAFVISFVGTERYFARDFIIPLLGGALTGSFLVIPVHEIIHGVSYKLNGAPVIHFGADLKQMIFYVASDKFVLGRKGFYIVALSPFIIINALTLSLLGILPVTWVAGGICFLFFHNIMCIGDFSMVSFFASNKGKDLYTYDDHKEKVSFIFEKMIM